eukprot:CAMPEP_0206419442 /NCGR_PEP_ID=MMETSP0324_2-20121206/127_1 /ASSEMBLY_ACC=CAM_ASM_000836 /TAXON_ID=2866 /ORGANISM="Crypthecodinium cohnii, Strain Seligo" /LENGTH=49 /DNA_ID= /DNA_START= /DNA_END= /DNA_ORIENTATION=
MGHHKEEDKQNRKMNKTKGAGAGEWSLGMILMPAITPIASRRDEGGALY